MAEERQNGSSRGTVLILFLAFVILFLVVRISAVREDRDEALDAVAAHRMAEAERVKERDRALEAQGRALAQVDAQAGRVKTLQDLVTSGTKEVAEIRAAHAKTVSKIMEQLGQVRRERDAVTRRAIEAGDRHASLETVLLAREAELASLRVDLEKARNPSEVDRAAMLVGSEDAGVRAIGVQRLATLGRTPRILGLLRQALMASESEAEALSVLRVTENPDAVVGAETAPANVFVRRAVARVTGDPKRLLALLEDTDAPVRAAAAARMGASREPIWITALRDSAGDPDVTVRSAVALALAQLGDWEGVTPLLADEDVRVARCALAGFVAGGRVLPEGVKVHPELASAVALSRRLLSDRPESD